MFIETPFIIFLLLHCLIILYLVYLDSGILSPIPFILFQQALSFKRVEIVTLRNVSSYILACSKITLVAHY